MFIALVQFRKGILIADRHVISVLAIRFVCFFFIGNVIRFEFFSQILRRHFHIFMQSFDKLG